MKKYIAILCGIGILAAGCGTTGSNEASTSANGGVTLKNCGEEVTYQHHDKLWVHDGSIISIALGAGAGDKINWVSSMQKDKDILRAKYGDIVDRLDEAAEKTPSLEEVVSKKPDIMVAGWNYGFSESNDLNPERLKSQGIDSYILTESCRQGSTGKRGVVEPWQAVRDDVGNLGKIAGSEATATQVIDDMDTRLDNLKAAPQAEKKPTVFVFDSVKDGGIFTSGKFGGPQAIIEAAGGNNATADIDDTWTNVGWEKIASSTPDVFVMVDYPNQSFEDKVEALRSNPVTKDLPAVKENRFINLPYAMWCSGPLNIDAAEHVRKGMEKFNVVPQTDIQPQLTLPASVPGQEYVQ
jgi:putative secreted protein